MPRGGTVTTVVAEGGLVRHYGNGGMMAVPGGDGPIEDVYRDLHAVTVKYQDALHEIARLRRANAHIIAEFGPKHRPRRRWGWRR